LGGAKAVIDLHAHTTASDGTDEPQDLVQRAAKAGLSALAITDHDTFAGYEAASPVRGLRLIRGIEVSAGRVHLLGYFFGEPRPAFREWLATLLEKRRERNREIASRLRSLGVDITLQEAEALGKSVTCRPHFARLLIDKGYVSRWEEAFTLYLGEESPAYVERQDPAPEEAIARLREGGGVACIAHPGRIRCADIGRYIEELASAGLMGVEVFHSDHNERDRRRFLTLAHRLNLAVTGGSDFHGTNKPGVELGHGKNRNVWVPSTLLDDLSRRATEL
jgi:3',5'-nucleoside bisphosphate phosphatase